MVYNNYTKFEKNEIVSKMNFREKKSIQPDRWTW